MNKFVAGLDEQIEQNPEHCHEQPGLRSSVPDGENACAGGGCQWAIGARSDEGLYCRWTRGQCARDCARAIGARCAKDG